MSYLAITKWDRHQHYKKRRPPWIKFYTDLLDDEPLRRLPVSTRLLWDHLLLLAGRFGNAIPNDPERIAMWTAIPKRDVSEGIDQLVKGRWIRRTQTARRASKSDSGAASNGDSVRAEAEAEKALLLSQGRSALQDVSALPDQSIDLEAWGAATELRLNGERAPRGSVESILEVLPPTQIKTNTRPELTKYCDVLSVAQVEHIRNEVLAARGVSNLAGYAVSIAKSRAEKKANAS